MRLNRTEKKVLNRTIVFNWIHRWVTISRVKYVCVSLTKHLNVSPAVFECVTKNIVWLKAIIVSIFAQKMSFNFTVLMHFQSPLMCSDVIWSAAWRDAALPCAGRILLTLRQKPSIDTMNLQREEDEEKINGSLIRAYMKVFHPQSPSVTSRLARMLEAPRFSQQLGRS